MNICINEDRIKNCDLELDVAVIVMTKVSGLKNVHPKVNWWSYAVKA
jgi:hypothetical protein